MTSRFTRRQIVQRGAAGVTILSLPGLLAACGGGGDGGGGGGTSETLRFANWQLYIDVDEKTKKSPTLEQFQTKTGITVEYSDDNGATWAYAPASGGGGAPAGYDANVTNVRYVFTGSLLSGASSTTGVGFTVRIQ